MKLSVGNSAAVKPGVMDPDFDFDIGGWQGRIEEINDDDEGLVLIRWDSVTLEQTPLELIIRSENEGFDWQVMMLSQTELEITEERDSTTDTQNAADLIKNQIIDDPRLDNEEEDDDDDDQSRD